MQAAGFVLVGGKSSRMGRDKALLPGRSRYLVEEVADAVEAVVGNVVLVGEPNRYRALNYRCIADLRPDLGPLSGIETALASTRSELNLVLACDMPAIDGAQLNALLERAAQSPSPCVATRDAQGRVHPLCAVYKREGLPVVRRRLDEGRLALIDLLEELQAEYVPFHGVVANLNTPDDWAHWKSTEPEERKAPWQALT